MKKELCGWGVPSKKKIKSSPFPVGKGESDHSSNYRGGANGEGRADRGRVRLEGA